MRSAYLALSALATHLVAANEFLAHQAKYANNFASYDSFEEDFQTRIVASTSTFLNSKTQPYAVNGTALPLLPDVGESYSGLLPIDDTGRELFFWFFPSSTGAGSDEITIWLNGGPGCSSLEGLLEENGPCVFRPSAYGAHKNAYAFNRLSNVVWIEQPVGTGFSQGKPNATNEIEVAAQFNAFWKNFVDLFDLQNYPIYITGESYAGQYVPYIGDGMLNNSDTTYYNLKGIMIYDPVVGPGKYIVPAAVPFAIRNSESFPFEPSVWESLLSLQDSCGWTDFLNNGLQFPPTEHLPAIKVTKECDLYDALYTQAVLINPCFNIYQVSQICPVPGDILGYIASRTPKSIPALSTPYFNRDDVKALIHAPLNTTWQECSNGVLTTDTSPGSGTANGPIMRIAEKINNVVVGHALQDAILLSNQTLLTLNDLEWNGKQGFDSPPTQPLWVPTSMNATSTKYKYLGSWTTARGITFLETTLSGHMQPQYQPGASFRHLEFLLGRVSNLSAQVPFTV